MSPRKNNLPPEHNGIQYNFCKNPKCNNYGVEPTKVTVGSKDLPYSINYAGKGMPILVCNLCKETPPLKSNLGIHEEIERLMAHMQPVEVLTCPDVECKNHLVPVGTKKAYRAYGKTAQGAKRYRCGECGKTFSQARPMQGQRETHHNIDIFKMLVNKVPLSRIIAMLGISWELLYNRIDFIHSQCQRFSANREKRLSDMEIEKLYISIDRQDHVLNWAERKDKRNIVLSAITSVDNSFDDGFNAFGFANITWIMFKHLDVSVVRVVGRHALIKVGRNANLGVYAIRQDVDVSGCHCCCLFNIVMW